MLNGSHIGAEQMLIYIPFIQVVKKAFRSVKDPEEKGIFCLLMNLKGW